MIWYYSEILLASQLILIDLYLLKNIRLNFVNEFIINCKFNNKH